MAKTVSTGVIPGIVAAPASPSKASNYKPKANGAAMPAGNVNPMLPLGGKMAGKK
jgi:hypothetical protein